MQIDFKDVSFNRNGRLESAAREAALGIRWMGACILFNLAAFACTIAAIVYPAHESLLGWVGFALAVGGFCTGAYAIYAVMDAMGWSGAVSGVIILILLIPYLKLLVPRIVSALAAQLIDRAGMVFSLTGPLRRRGPPPLPKT